MVPVAFRHAPTPPSLPKRRPESGASSWDCSAARILIGSTGLGTPIQHHCYWPAPPRSPSPVSARCRHPEGERPPAPIRLPSPHSPTSRHVAPRDLSSVGHAASAHQVLRLIDWLPHRD